MPSKAFKLAEAMVSNPVMSDMVENPTATPTQIAAVETKTSAISDTGVISVNTKNIVSNNVLTQSFDSNQVVGFNLTDSIDAVSPIVSVFKEVPQQGFSSKGQWDVNSNATNYEFFDEKPISYSSITLTPSATGDGTFTLSSGSFDSADVGKKVIGNSGSAIITGTSGTYNSVTPFADTSAISSWQLFSAEGKSDGSGIQLSGYSLPHTNVSTPTHTKTYTWPTSYAKLGNIKISPDGTSFYATHYNSTSGLVHRFSLSSPYDISSATFTESLSFNLIRDILWNSDGTKLYGLGNAANNGIFTKVASTPYSLANMTNGTTVTSTFTTDTGGNTLMKGFCFSTDKTQLYIANHGTNYIYQYSLDGDPGEIDSGLTYVGAVATGINNPHTIEMQADGLKIWFTCYLEGASSRYHYLPLSTAFDITSAGSRVQQYFPSPANSVGGNSRTPIFTFNEEQTIMYVSSTGNADPTDNIFQFDIGTISLPYSTYSPALTNSSNGQINSSSWVDINSMTADETKNDGDVFYAVSTDSRTSWGVAKASDGVRKIVKNNSGTWQYNNDGGISTVVGYDLSNSATLNKTLSYNSQEANGGGMAFNNDGTKLYLIGEQNNLIHEYTLSTAYDISTSSYNSVTFDPSILSAIDIKWKPDGTKIYIMDYDSSVRGTIYTFNVSTAWDITTASSASETFRGNAQDSSFVKFAFKTDGTRLYKLGRQGNKIYAYDLSTAWDVSSASYASEELPMANVVANSTVNTYMNGLAFNSSGTKVFVAVYDPSNTSNNRIYEIDLSTAWDIGIDNNNNGNYAGVYLNTDRVINVLFNGDGSQVYAMNNTTDTILSYSSGSASMVYSTSETWVNGTNNNEHATLQEALGAQSFNRMNKAQLDAVADAYHFSQDSADTLDLMIAPYAASGISPISDGVTINYDAAALVREAIPGTDYVAEFPNSSTINIKSLVNANMKVRAL